MGQVGTAVAGGQEAGAATGLVQAAADQRHTLADADRRDVPARYGEWETVYGLFRR